MKNPTLNCSYPYVVYSDEDKSRLRQTPILEVIEVCTGKSVVLTGGGMCRSPFKPGGDSTPSFHVDIAKNVWTDFSQPKTAGEMAASKNRSANKGGDAYAFVKEYLNIQRGEEWRIWETLAKCNPSVTGKVVDTAQNVGAPAVRPHRNSGFPQGDTVREDGPEPSTANAAALGLTPDVRLPFKADGRSYGCVRQYHQFQMLSFVTETVHDKAVHELLERVTACPDGLPYSALTSVMSPSILKSAGWTPVINVSTLREGLLHALATNQDSDFAKRLNATGEKEICFPKTAMLKSWEQVLKTARDFLRRRDMVDDWKVRVEQSEVKTEKLTDENLIGYGVRVRCIPERILKRYFSQSVETRELPSKKEPGTTWVQTFRNLAFPKSPLTKGEGISAWNLRSVPYMKNGVEQNIKRNAGSRGPTVTRISMTGQLLTLDAPLTSKNVRIFEGCFDFVSWLADRNLLIPCDCEVIVLNSTANVHHVGSLLSQYDNALMCLDRDEAGKECLLTAVDYFFDGQNPGRCSKNGLPGLRTKEKSLFDFSGQYGPGCKDYNEKRCAALKAGQGKCREDYDRFSESSGEGRGADIKKG